MTGAALRVLSKEGNGFVLMVDGAHIDKQTHATDAERAIGDTLEFDRAVKVVRRIADEEGSALIIALADARNRLLTRGTVPMSRPGWTQRSRRSSPRRTKKGVRSFPD